MQKKTFCVLNANAKSQTWKSMKINVIFTVVEDEKHFLFNCNIYYDEWREYYEECAKLFRNFSDMNEDDKLKNIFWKCWKITLRYVNSLWEKRKVRKGWIHCMICIICYDIECMCGYTMPYMYLSKILFIHNNEWWTPQNQQVVTNIDLQLSDISIERTKYTKFIGIYIDERLKWDEHINVMKTKISESFLAINKVKHILPRNMLTTLYYSLIYIYISILDEGILLWGAACQSHLLKLTIVQKKSVTNINIITKHFTNGSSNLE